jgi:hypothetical protein
MVKRVSGARRADLVNIKNLFGRVTLLIGRFLKLGDEQRRINGLTRRCVEPWYENSISVITKQR